VKPNAARLRLQCEKIAELPGTIGRARPELGTDIRSFSFGNYLIIFRYGQDTLDIIEIVHARRDIAAHFDEGGE
jgi:toxin ParE1/3/4